jgi:uncharacterized membrane protein (UPF0127 family)
MFSRRKNAKALLFEFKKPTKMAIHSYFVFFPFAAVWLNKNNEVVDFRRVKPFEFRISPSEKFVKLIEIPETLAYNFLKFPTGKERFK